MAMILLDAETIEARWQRFAAAVEVALGHGLEGDELRDGYSVASAYAWWEAGRSVRAYVAEVHAGPVYKGIRTQGAKVN